MVGILDVALFFFSTAMLQNSKNVPFYGCWQGSDQQILDSLFSMANRYGLPQGERINLLHQGCRNNSCLPELT